MRPLARDPRVLIGWPFPLGLGLDGRLLLARRGRVCVQFTTITTTTPLTGELKTFFRIFSGVEYGPKYAIFFGRGRGVFRVFRSVFPYWRRSGQINGHLRKKRHRRCALKERRPSKRSSQADSQAAFRSGGCNPHFLLSNADNHFRCRCCLNCCCAAC